MAKTRKLPKLRKIDKSKKKHHYKLKDPFSKRKLAIHEGVNMEAKKTGKTKKKAAIAKKGRFNILRIYRKNKKVKECKKITHDMRYMDRKYGLGKTKNICGGRRKKQKTKKKKCIKKNKYSVRIDPGYPDKYRGWYDVQKCGKCQDYCRWVGNSGPGGNPKFRTEKKIKGKKKSWWSCWLADASEGKTLYSSNKRWKKSFNYKRCTREGNTTKRPNSKTGENWNF